MNRSRIHRRRNSIRSTGWITIPANRAQHRSRAGPTSPSRFAATASADLGAVRRRQMPFGNQDYGGYEQNECNDSAHTRGPSRLAAAPWNSSTSFHGSDVSHSWGICLPFLDKFVQKIETGVLLVTYDRSEEPRLAFSLASRVTNSCTCGNIRDAGAARVKSSVSPPSSEVVARLEVSGIDADDTR